ncbi:PREDICTED: tetratricopeptide repeat protein 29-like [Nicrophorus vespilloides]|uniref:Tetratricopeptide repeat protein 29 n=1 Tax=Nicrophorus vespilloides TaxID=110193 RepID=A0ABM1N1X9_NICVS|nr:PREDICTED: tetratricopeptide repeat protein 29-like [Nicrophorus vespilloides]
MASIKNNDRSSMSLLQIPRVKREKMLKAEKERKKTALRAELPVLNREQIRRFRLPYDQAIMEELEEKGFTNSREYLKLLMQWQENYRKEHHHEIVVMARPLLRHTTVVLDYLSAGFSEAETAHFSGELGTEIDKFLLLAIHYGFATNSDWYWLADHFFAMSIEISSDYKADGGFRAAQVRYIYGKYLLQQNINEDQGIDILNEASALSEGKTWCATKILKTLQKPIFIEVSKLLYATLIIKVQNNLLSNPELALDLCYMARKRAYEACLPRADIMLLQGKCEIENSMADRAANSFKKAQLLYKSSGIIEKDCEARICLALAYLELGKWEKSHEELINLLTFAESNKLPQYVGKSYLYIGQYHLNQGTPEQSTPYLVKALNIFHEINDVANREFVKNLAAVSKGQEFVEHFVSLILRCESDDGNKRGRNLLRLLHWKDTRLPFWDDLTESLNSEYESIKSSILEESLDEEYSEESDEEEQDEEEEEEYENCSKLIEEIHSSEMQSSSNSSQKIRFKE